MQTIKYGVTSIDNLCSDLLMWNTLYLAGRMHKPLRIIKDDARVRLTQQVNLTSALRAALLTLPSHFNETDLFQRITSISYEGDPRMILPAENRSKIANIVSKQSPQFKELYHRLALGLPGVHWSSTSATIEQDMSPHIRASLIKKLPATLRTRLTDRYSSRAGIPAKEADESAFWVRIAGDADLSDVLRKGLSFQRHGSELNRRLNEFSFLFLLEFICGRDERDRPVSGCGANCEGCRKCRRLQESSLLFG